MLFHFFGFWLRVVQIIKFQITNPKYQTNHNNQNPKSQTGVNDFGRLFRIPMFWSLNIGI
jgi:hypothetical protein